MSPTEPLVAVYLVTYRRPEMLKRALASALGQTHRNIIVRVVNDDPADPSVGEIITATRDERALPYQPIANRGATRNFNLMFDERDAQFVALLEDDNWWEPNFIATMVDILGTHPDAAVVVGNERIWQELPNGSWSNTGTTVWSFRGVKTYAYSLEDLCSGAKVCNSSTVFKLPFKRDYRTPDTIPVDVTEFFRERLLDASILLCGDALVNYANTIDTARSKGDAWGIYQMMIVGSVFAALSDAPRRKALAKSLWSEVAVASSPRAVALIQNGLIVPEARALLIGAPWTALARFLLWFVRHPSTFVRYRSGVIARKSEFMFLVNAPLTRTLCHSPGEA